MVIKKKLSIAVLAMLVDLLALIGVIPVEGKEGIMALINGAAGLYVVIQGVVDTFLVKQGEKTS